MGFPEGVPEPRLELPDVIGAMRSECQRAGSAPRYVEQLHKRYADLLSVQLLEGLAEFIEPAASIGDDGSARQASKAYFRGALIGMRLAEETYGDKADELIEHMKIDAPDPASGIDDIALRYKISGLLMQCGDQGVCYASQYEDMIDEWSDSLCADASYRHFVKRGFGIVVFSMQQYFEGQAERDYLDDLGTFEKSIEGIHDYDWDAHFDELNR